jgi:ABC-type dipeptide/oligopeptide/nickel transport system permease subunit
MSETSPPSTDDRDERSEYRRPFARSSGSTVPESVHTGEQIEPGMPFEISEEMALAYEQGVDVEARSHWAYARKRFVRHRLAMASLVMLTIIISAGMFANRVAPYGYADIDLLNTQAPPSIHGTTTLDPTTGETVKGKPHFFGTDLLGRDYFSRVLYGIRTSARVAFVVASLSTIIGTAIGAIAGYFGGWSDNLLMRITDLILTVPGLAILLVASAFLGNGSPYRVAVILALLFWTALARIVRGSFLSLREKEFVEAAKASGSGDFRIIIKHMLPNTLGPIIVTATLTVAAAILVEAVLSFLGFGIQPPTPALGKLISDGQGQMIDAWWLVTFPGLVIVAIVLCINFIGDGLRDALDPTQRKVSA